MCTNLPAVDLNTFYEALEAQSKHWVGQPNTSTARAAIRNTLSVSVPNYLYDLHRLYVKPDDIEFKVEPDPTDPRCITITAQIKEQDRFRVVDSLGNFWDELDIKLGF